MVCLLIFYSAKIVMFRAGRRRERGARARPRRGGAADPTCPRSPTLAPKKLKTPSTFYPRRIGANPNINIAQRKRKY